MHSGVGACEDWCGLLPLRFGDAGAAWQRTGHHVGEIEGK